MCGRVKITKKKRSIWMFQELLNLEHLLGQVQPHSSKATKYKA